MRVINDLKGVRLKNTAVCLGNFDGLHLGHRQIISIMKEEAAATHAETVIFTFYPHPLKFFGKDITLLATPRRRQELFEEQGVDYLINAPFNSALASLPPEDFFKNIIMETLGAKIVVVGKDYRFGAERSGGTDTLSALGNKYGIKCVFVEKLRSADGEEISSSRIRCLIAEGFVDKAHDLLGSFYSLEGLIIHGDGRGKDFGFPTVNINTSGELVPPAGVYATDILINGVKYPSVTYIGTRPTITSDKEMRVETNIFDFNKDVYGEFAQVFFKKRIRGEMKFSSIKELKSQMAIDSVAARGNSETF